MHKMVKVKTTNKHNKYAHLSFNSTLSHSFTTTKLNTYVHLPFNSTPSHSFLTTKLKLICASTTSFYPKSLIPDHQTRSPFYQLGRCGSREVCGFIRQDTLESYYTCSCPQKHLCLFLRPKTPKIVTHMHFHGWAYTARCTPNYWERLPEYKRHKKKLKYLPTSLVLSNNDLYF